MGDPAPGGQVRIFGRYALHAPIASGGMATVHYGRLLGPVGFSRTVAVKRLHAEHARDPEFVMMFLDEARLAARIRHPNVVPTIDVVAEDGELFLVMEYVDGESLGRLIRKVTSQKELIPPAIACSILSGTLRGLHAAHEARSERGERLDIVHRDVSPQNVIVGKDGLAHVVDFGVAKASGRLQTTRDGHIKGKLAYMAPEVFAGAKVTRAVDIYGAGVILWECIVGQRLFGGESEAEIIGKVLAGKVPRPSTLVAGVPEGLDAVVAKSLDPNPANRFATADDMASALEATIQLAIPALVGAWVARVASDVLMERAHLIAEIESSSSRHASGAPTGHVMPAPSRPEPVDNAGVTVQFDAGSGVSQLSSVADATFMPRPLFSHWRTALIVAPVLCAVVATVVVLSVVRGRTPATPAGLVAPQTSLSLEKVPSAPILPAVSSVPMSPATTAASDGNGTQAAARDQDAGPAGARPQHPPKPTRPATSAQPGAPKDPKSQIIFNDPG